MPDYNSDKTHLAATFITLICCLFEAAKVHSNLMCRLSIVFSVALLLCAGDFARCQEKPIPSQDSQPLLKRCSDKNPPPCADKPPTLNYSPEPQCSKDAEKAKISGTIVLNVVVGTDGLAHDISVVRSVGYGMDEEAIKALKKWKFKPAKGSGRPAPVQISVEVKFRCPA
jgi:TonB family protein